MRDTIWDCLKTNGRVPCRNPAAEFLNFAKQLEPFFDPDEPEPAFVIGGLLVKTVFEGSSHEWWLFVSHVVHAHRERHIVQPGPPSARVILGGRDRHHVLLLAILHLHVLAAILGISGHFVLGRGWWQVEGVIDNQIQGHEFTHLAIERSLARNECVPRNVAPFPVRIGKYGRDSGIRYKIHGKSRKTGALVEQIRSEARPCPCIVEGKLSIVPVLPDVVDHGTGIDALHPRTGRAVVEYTRVPAIVGIGAAAVNTLETAAELANGRESLAVRHSLDVHVSHIGFVPRRGKGSPVAMTEPRSVEYLDRFEVPSTQDFAAEILLRREQQKNRTIKSVARDGRSPQGLETGHGILRARVVDQELRIDRGSESADVDVDEIRREGQALQRTPPFVGSKHGTIGVLISNFRLQVAVTLKILFDLNFRGEGI